MLEWCSELRRSDCNIMAWPHGGEMLVGDVVSEPCWKEVTRGDGMNVRNHFDRMKFLTCSYGLLTKKALTLDTK